MCLAGRPNSNVERHDCCRAINASRGLVYHGAQLRVALFQPNSFSAELFLPGDTAQRGSAWAMWPQLATSVMHAHLETTAISGMVSPYQPWCST